MKKIRAVSVAQHLGISSAQLREFIAQINFGVAPTDREFPESVANGIVRFVARKLGKKIAPIVEIADEKIDEKADEENSVEEKKEESQLEKLAKIAQKPIEKKSENSAASKTAIFRKIEIDPAVAAKAREKIETEKTKSKEEREREKLEEKIFAARKKSAPKLVKKTGTVEIPANISVKEFSEKIGVPVSEIISELLKNGVIATINKSIDFETAQIVALALEVELKKVDAGAASEDLISGNLEKILADEKENLKPRPPVVVIMGHVDHGKTKILDFIRKSKIVESEAGGITQHIGATQISHNSKKITFLDTPGHEAFTAMRARGAKTADIAILVVAADEGLREQTLEAIDHARDANLPIIVAINKIDKENANIDKVKGELAEKDLSPEDWGGKTVCAPVSALRGDGIDELLEMILLVAEMQNLTANPDRAAVGTVVESNLDPAFGPVATILINAGKLKIGQDFLIGNNSGRVKTMIDSAGKKVKSAPPAFPVRISGLEKVPETGEILQVFASKKILKQKLEKVRAAAENLKAAGVGKILEQIRHGKIKFLNIVLKADVRGSLEAVKSEIEKIEHAEVAPKIVHAGVGAISESDVNIAAAGGGVVFGFNAKISPQAKKIAERLGVEVKDFKIIFELTDIVKKILEGLLEPEFEEKITARAKVAQIFWTKGKTRICGCKFEKGILKKGQKLRVFRGEEKVGEGQIAILQHFEKKVKEVSGPGECGIQFEGKVAVEVGDEFEAFEVEKKIKTL
jgi:translation initiation factor IF-2